MFFNCRRKKIGNRIFVCRAKKKLAKGEKTNEEIKESVGRIKFRTDFDIIQERESEVGSVLSAPKTTPS